MKMFCSAEVGKELTLDINELIYQFQKYSEIIKRISFEELNIIEEYILRKKDIK